MLPETLKPTEAPAKPANEHSGASFKLDEQQINSLILSRKEILENIKNEISRKVYFQIEEKINREEKQLNELLDFQEGRQNQLSKYTFVLDTHYFEQEIIS